MYCQLTINVSDWLLHVSVGACVSVVCVCQWCACHVAPILAPQRNLKNMFMDVVLWGSCHTINRQFVMGDVCRSWNASLSAYRSAYNGVKYVSEPFMSEAGMSQHRSSQYRGFSVYSFIIW